MVKGRRRTNPFSWSDDRHEEDAIAEAVKIVGRRFKERYTVQAMKNVSFGLNCLSRSRNVRVCRFASSIYQSDGQFERVRPAQGYLGSGSDLIREPLLERAPLPTCRSQLRDAFATTKSTGGI